jgi:hypothetical protein
MNRIFATPSALVLLTVAVVTSPMTARSEERLGTSCADCPSYKGAFSIENATGVTIPYQVRWGNTHAWKTIALRSGYTETHSYPMGDNRGAQLPTPYVRFDRIAGDGQSTPREYRMGFHAVGYAGYGAATNTVQPKRYYFKYAPDGRTLELFSR